jgi:hypothetical protein
VERGRARPALASDAEPVRSLRRVSPRSAGGTILSPVLVTKSPLRTRAGETYGTEASRASLRLILLEAVLWATNRADPVAPATSLRSSACAPYVFCASRFETVDGVALSRHLKLEAEGRVHRMGGRTDDVVEAASLGLGDLQALVHAGRLLVWERDTTIDDGAGEAETKGYLDESDMPPWDTWVAYVDPHPHAGYLVSWVPAPFVEPVARAVDVNAYDALYWLRDSKLLLAEVLREERLLA